ncbi:MAG TPA: DUF423 domain-containing protein [Candidatus Paenalcaligenes intestinipullorum]|uniref:DUF423 domain-containing protein n=1 Tax=Candidatus Paenalcaligenes intestinipullorum TaxID=2838718 RepID=A0A9D2U9H7_9BURK|nr:DUF423 domain-containing protein [Candidatus Paenalcaligenes intestinipullorum]
MQTKTLCGIAALFIAISVAAGAWGSHALTQNAPLYLQTVWHTAADYQIKQALGLLALAAVQGFLSPRLGRLAAPVIIIGSALFSFSLYLLVLTGTPWLGYVTPIGGTLMVAGWLLVFAAAFMPKRFIKNP